MKDFIIMQFSCKFATKLKSYQTNKTHICTFDMGDTIVLSYYCVTVGGACSAGICCV